MRVWRTTSQASGCTCDRNTHGSGRNTNSMFDASCRILSNSLSNSESCCSAACSIAHWKEAVFDNLSVSNMWDQKLCVIRAPFQHDWFNSFWLGFSTAQLILRRYLEYIWVSCLKPMTKPVLSRNGNWIATLLTTAEAKNRKGFKTVTRSLPFLHLILRKITAEAFPRIS